MAQQYSDIFAERILSLCKDRGISVNKLATISGLNQSTIENIIKGNSKSPQMITLHKIATAFNMTITEFLNFKELNEYSFED